MHKSTQTYKYLKNQNKKTESDNNFTNYKYFQTSKENNYFKNINTGKKLMSGAWWHTI